MLHHSTTTLLAFFVALLTSGILLGSATGGLA